MQYIKEEGSWSCSMSSTKLEMGVCRATSCWEARRPLSLFSPPRGARGGSWWSPCVCSISLRVTSSC